jgi:hypothetical protein
MASIMIFSTLWGIALREWNGTGRRTKMLVAASLLVLIASTVVVGYGNYLGVAAAQTRSSLARWTLWQRATGEVTNGPKLKLLLFGGTFY